MEQITAQVHQVAVKDSHRHQSRGDGLRKLPVERLVVGVSGCEGDFNKYRTQHKSSTNDRAISIMTTELLDALTSEGWGPVLPGDLGENITVRAGDLNLRIGGVYSFGGEVVVQITELIQPCNKLLSLPYVGRQRRAEFMNTLQGRRGWYAKVLTEGSIHPGDPVCQIE